MVVTKRQLANYLGVSYPTARKQYDFYLDSVNKASNMKLTIYDLMKVDGISMAEVQKELLK